MNNSDDVADADNCCVNQDDQNEYTIIEDNGYVRSTEPLKKEYVNVHNQKIDLLRKIYLYQTYLTPLEKQQIIELLQAISAFHKQGLVCNKNRVLELYRKYKTTLAKIRINLLDVIKLTFANNSYSLKTIMNYMDKIHGDLD